MLILGLALLTCRAGAEDWEAVRTAVPPQHDPLFGDTPDERYRVLRRRIAAAA